MAMTIACPCGCPGAVDGVMTRCTGTPKPTLTVAVAEYCFNSFMAASQVF